MLQEATTGKVSKHHARHYLKSSCWDLRQAVGLMFHHHDEKITRCLSREDVLKDLDSKFESRIEVRMFACGDCDRIWWYRVPSRKPVSKCRKCLLKYDAIPRHQEYGWCKYHCKRCDRVFSGYGSMGHLAESPCYKCGRCLYPSQVLPPERRGTRRSPSDHSCTGGNCCNRTRGRAQGQCVHPRSTRRRVVIASRRHVSSGSTVDTFLSQDDVTDGPFRPELSDIDEGEDM